MPPFHGFAPDLRQGQKARLMDTGPSYHKPLVRQPCEREGLSRPVSRILLSDAMRRPGDHLSGSTVTCALWQPTRGSPPVGAGHGSRPSFRSPLCLALLPMGVAWPGQLPGPPVVSYTTFSPLRARGSAPAHAVCLCGPIRGSPRPGVTRHRTLWSPDFPQPWANPGPRPPGLLRLDKLVLPSCYRKRCFRQHRFGQRFGVSAPHCRRR